MCHEGTEWRYERGEGRYKHRWRHDYAGFVPGDSGPVGKCPKHIDQELAERILNERGIPVYQAEDSAYPDFFYAVYQGVVYAAAPTNPGYSYHAYPWRGDLPGRCGLGRRLRRQLRECADRHGERKELERWLKQYDPNRD